MVEGGGATNTEIALGFIKEHVVRHSKFLKK